jgi:antitoxin ParD1/3/4
MNKEGRMPTRNVVLTEHHQQLIDSLVKSGRYQNASEVLREGLRLVEERETEDEKRRAFREAVDVGIRDLERGNYVEFESFGKLDSYLRDRMSTILERHRK